MYKHCIIIVVFLSFSVSFLYAQSGQNTQDSGAIDEPRVTVLPPAYNPQMMRLSEILGALHYLRELCGAKEGQKWREQMQAMLEAEQPIAERRAQMGAAGREIVVAQYDIAIEAARLARLFAEGPGEALRPEPYTGRDHG